jgi:hypothetical protein
MVVVEIKHFNDISEMVSEQVKVPYHLLDIQSWSKKHKLALHYNLMMIT